MNFIADMLLLLAALGAGIYCYVLSRRLKRFTDLESGMGGAVAVLSVQVDDMKRALENARRTADGTAEQLESVTARAEDTARRLEMAMAATHDFPRPNLAASGESGGRSVRRRRRASAEAADEVAA